MSGKEDGASAGSPEFFSSHQSDSSATELGLVDSDEVSEDDSDDDTLYNDDLKQHSTEYYLAEASCLDVTKLCQERYGPNTKKILAKT